MKKCKTCKKYFNPNRPLQAVCSPQCAFALPKGKASKIIKLSHRADKKEMVEKLMTKGDYEKLLQVEINTLIREIDKYVPCISSNRHWKKTDQAGHYLSRGAFPALRFSLWNIYSQSVSDNFYKSGNQEGFRLGLIKKFGVFPIEHIADLRVKYPVLNLSVGEINEAKKNTKECIKMVRLIRVNEGLEDVRFPIENRVKLRKDCTELIGIYK